MEDSNEFVPNPSPNTPDPEYNTEAVHSGPNDPWFTQETPPDETYHPHDEELIHGEETNRVYAPQERETFTGQIEAYLPKVNTGGKYEPEPYDPAPEDDCMHIVTYGTIEDVAFADGDGTRENGLVSLSVRDSMDDLIHTDFHTLNPLSPLGPNNVRVGDRVRVDIQDYKNIIEWFVYNYPTVLEAADILQIRPADGPWFQEDQQTTLDGNPVPLFGKIVKGGSINEEPKVFSPSSAYEDFEHQNIGSLLDQSYLEIGQRDGNKKMTVRQFLDLIDNYFHITDIWKTLRDHEKRIVHLERDARREDETRVTVDEFEIGYSQYAFPVNTLPEWQDPSEDHHGFPSLFLGNSEQSYFSLRINYINALREWQGCGDQYFVDPMGVQPHKGGKVASKIFIAGTIPEKYRPSEFRWVKNYVYVVSGIGGWLSLTTGMGTADVGFDTDGSVWVDPYMMDECVPRRDEVGIFGIRGDPGHMSWLGVEQGVPAAGQSYIWKLRYSIRSFGGVITTSSNKW